MNRSMKVMAVGLLGLAVLLTGCGFHLQGSGAGTNACACAG